MATLLSIWSILSKVLGIFNIFKFFKLYKIFKYFKVVQLFISGLEKAKEDGKVTVQEAVDLFEVCLIESGLADVVIYGGIPTQVTKNTNE